MKELNTKGCCLLCQAIVLQAVQDYRKVLRGEPVRPNVAVVKTKKEVEKFFESEWFKLLTKLDGAYLMRKLKEEYVNESESYPKYKSPYRNDF